MQCPRCTSNSYVTFYEHDELKCTACGHVGYNIPEDVLQEYQKHHGEVGEGTHFIRKNSKKYH